MKKIKFIAAISGALTMVFLALFLISSSAGRGAQSTAVYVASKNIKANQQITEDMLEYKKVPGNLVVEGAAKNKDELLGKMAKVDILKNSVISKENVYKEGEPKKNGGLTYVIAKGKRAISFPVEYSTGISSLLRGGDRVDIILTRAKDSNFVSKTILSNVKILALGNDYSVGVNKSGSEGKSYSTVTVELSPEDCVKLMNGSKAGTLSLSLRTPGDNSSSSKSEYVSD